MEESEKWNWNKAGNLKKNRLRQCLYEGKISKKTKHLIRTRYIKSAYTKINE